MFQPYSGSAYKLDGTIIEQQIVIPVSLSPRVLEQVFAITWWHSHKYHVLRIVLFVVTLFGAAGVSTLWFSFSIQTKSLGITLFVMCMEILLLIVCSWIVRVKRDMERNCLIHGLVGCMVLAWGIHGVFVYEISKSILQNNRVPTIVFSLFMGVFSICVIKSVIPLFERR